MLYFLGGLMLNMVKASDLNTFPLGSQPSLEANPDPAEVQFHTAGPSGSRALLGARAYLLVLAAVAAGFSCDDIEQSDSRRAPLPLHVSNVSVNPEVAKDFIATVGLKQGVNGCTLISTYEGMVEVEIEILPATPGIPSNGYLGVGSPLVLGLVPEGSSVKVIVGSETRLYDVADAEETLADSNGAPFFPPR